MFFTTSASFLSYPCNYTKIEKNRYELQPKEKKAALITFVALSILTLGAYAVIQGVIRGVRELKYLKECHQAKSNYNNYIKKNPLSNIVTPIKPQNNEEFQSYVARNEAALLHAKLKGYRNIPSLVKTYTTQYYPRSTFDFLNMIEALELFSKKNDDINDLSCGLTNWVKVGQFTDPVPSVGQVFECAMEKDSCFRQTIDKILTDKTGMVPAADIELAHVGEEVLQFLSRTFPDLNS